VKMIRLFIALVRAVKAIDNHEDKHNDILRDDDALVYN
jgi:hypothetical protein